MKVAIIEKYPSNVDFSKYFNFEFDSLYLCESPIDKVLKKDITLDLNPDEYDFIILVGSEANKHIGKVTSVIKYQGHLMNEKFLPLANPAMLKMKPEGKDAFDIAIKNITKYITGEVESYNFNIRPIDSSKEVIEYIKFLQNKDITHITLDCETSALYPRDGYVLGISISHEIEQGVYINAECLDEYCVELLHELFKEKTVIFHNAKFDISMLSYNFGFEFPKFEDTMLEHYCLHEEPGTHDLKTLALKYTKAGDYEKGLNEFKTQYCKLHGILLEDFSYDLVPFDIMWPYAATDAAVTFQLFTIFDKMVKNSPNLSKVYSNLLIPGTDALVQIQENGVPFSKEKLVKAKKHLSEEIQKLTEELYKSPEILELEEMQSKKINIGSTQQLRTLLFDICGLPPTGILTDTGQYSTNEEALEELATMHPLPSLILDVRKLTKLENTYINKIIYGLDGDSRLRTNFNLHTTTSGRLSSSGKLNMQQLPRNNKLVKACIEAREGWKIVSQDLSTAEMYVAAVLSGDSKLQNVFVSKQDFHSTIGHMAFELSCQVEDVKKLFPEARQASKALSFGILYGSGPDKVAKVAGCSYDQAKDLISWYFNTFKKLDRWLTYNKDFVKQNGYCYSIFGRKRRVPNVFSANRAIAGHASRSAINFLVQSVASDINLFAAIEMQNYINDNNMKAKIFALVHDSIVAEVPDEEVQEYSEVLKMYTQKDRGCSIPSTPIGVDLEVGQDYSFK